MEEEHGSYFQQSGKPLRIIGRGGTDVSQGEAA